MWEILANWLLPKASKTCPKSNKSPNLVTLTETKVRIILSWVHRDHEIETAQRLISMKCESASHVEKQQHIVGRIRKETLFVPTRR